MKAHPVVLRRAVVLVVLLLAGLLTGGATGGAAEGTRDHHDEINGTEFRVKVPARWNGTLVLFSHGYYLAEYPPEPGHVMLATHPRTEQWLLDHGYALAASNYQGLVGYAVEDALRDQMAVLDWFEVHIGRPRQTITSGMSMGALVSIGLAERHPERFAGVLATCGEYDGNGTWNSALDITFAIKELLAPGADIDLVEARDPEASRDRLREVIADAQKSEQGRARLALAGALANIPGWSTTHQPAPTDLADRLSQQLAWVDTAYVYGIGPVGREDLERRAGGNPSWNVGIDYQRLLAQSAQRDLAVQAYRAAPGANLDADLDRLAKAPRITPDPGALAYMYRHTVVRGSTPSPVLTLHTIGDGGAVPDQVRWYAEQVRRHGDPDRLRSAYLSRGGHCSYSAAEEIVSLQALLARVNTGRWSGVDPAGLNAAVGTFAPDDHQVMDMFTGETKAVAPSFTRYTAPKFLRPSR
ncbi:hypothetical protein L3Q67_19255 [Saccharothrix sp. AJ9571]|nr:hypothetical protein L3Q67_19255 [Saccharothrix sp. AJ9571]